MGFSRHTCNIHLNFIGISYNLSLFFSDFIKFRILSLSLIRKFISGTLNLERRTLRPEKFLGSTNKYNTAI